MAGATRDIRSFFGAQPPAKKRRTTQADVDSDKSKPAKTIRPENEPSTSGVKKQDQEVQEQDQEQGDDEILPVTSFVELQKTIQLRSLMHQSWFDLLQREFARGSFQTLTRFLEGEEGRKKTIYPPPTDVFAALRDCAFSDLKVVILGQDPYHGPQQAHGLSFSEAMNDAGIDRPTHGCLSAGVARSFLLNTVLTVRRGDPTPTRSAAGAVHECHHLQVSKDASNVVFLLWGTCAGEGRADRHEAIWWCARHTPHH
ncbi:Uracil-DNA glycosylase, active site [Phytophthora cactorum]|nr:Uracil-DNA glycosylase, active site [Phytophthora cactorum]